MTEFLDRGWRKFAADPALEAWVASVRDAAWAAVDASENAHWHQCEGTWFVGVDALPNDAEGRVGKGPALAGAAAEFAAAQFGKLTLHRAQLSVIYEGYPRPRDGESAANAVYRKKRDAAHLDGLKPVGPKRRRKMDEFHGWILGVPLGESEESPLVVWEGSHIRLREMLRRAFEGVPPARWHEVDLTEAYAATRAEIFETCERVELRAGPGEATLVHRFTLHGVAPWTGGSGAPRMIAYFRPELPSRKAWLEGL